MTQLIFLRNFHTFHTCPSVFVPHIPSTLTHCTCVHLPGTFQAYIFSSGDVAFYYASSTGGPRSLGSLASVGMVGLAADASGCALAQGFACGTSGATDAKCSPQNFHSVQFQQATLTAGTAFKVRVRGGRTQVGPHAYVESYVAGFSNG